MEELYQHLLTKGPFWINLTIAGTIAGSIIFVVANRAYIKQLRTSYEDQLKQLREAHSEQIKLKDETIQMTNQAKAESQQLLREASMDALKERDMYRDRLHEEKANHQATLLRLSEVENRPDLSEILKTTTDYNGRMLAAIQSMELEFRKHSNLSTRSVKLLDGIVKVLIEKNILTPDFNKLIEST